MKIKLDENITVSVSDLLRSLGHDVDTVRDEGLAGNEDSIIWNAAQREGRFLITQDLDFSDLRNYAAGSHHGLLLLRLHLPSQQQMAQRIRELFQDEECNRWNGCMVVATEQKIRVIPPPGTSER
jgi:predicted nuclease of predicted toxin-antitoxin system